MHEISLNQVKPSPNPVRKTWDEEKMEELAASIKERGVIVPIKVRPAGGDYEIVYGHRRTEAARRAGLEEIPAIIEEPDDTDALIQALIENIQREDMNPVDVARGIKALMDATGATPMDIDRMGLMGQVHVRHHLRLLEEAPSVQARMARHVGGGKTATHNQRFLGEKEIVVSEDEMPITYTHVRYVQDSRLRTPQEREAVLLKASREHLNYLDTRAVADAYKQADTPELKDAVLKTSGKLGDADRILQVARMKTGTQSLSDRQQEERRQAFEEYDQAVKDFLDSVKLFDRMIKTARSAAKFGKFSPEGARFAARRIDTLIDELTALKEELGDV